MKKTSISILLIVVILVVINLLSDQFFFRIDLTEDQQYTLSNATEDIMKSLENPITVKAYFSENLPPNIAKTRKDFEEYLIEYANLSNTNLVYEFINPNESEEKEQEAIKAGVSPVMINVREKDQMKQQKAFLGATLELEEQKEIIPFMQPGAPLEYILSSAIKKIAVTDKPQVGLLQGFGQPAIHEIAAAASGLNVLYDFKPYTIDTTAIPSSYKTLALIRPTDTLSPTIFSQLDNYLEKGGNLFIALNKVSGDLSTSSGKAMNTGVASWLVQKGIQIKPDFVVDAQCASVSVRQQSGMFQFNTNVSFPYLPIISKFADHPITKGLEAVVMQFASPISYTAKDSLQTFTPIAFTSKNSGSLTAPRYFNIEKKWTETDLPLQHQTVAGVLEQKHGNGNTSRICIIADGDFAIGDQQSQKQGDNSNLLVNGIDWLSDDTGLIDLRTKGIQYRPLDKIEDGTKTVLKYLNFILPILLVIGYGIIRLQMNKNKRIKRMQADYSA